MLLAAQGGRKAQGPGEEPKLRGEERLRGWRGLGCAWTYGQPRGGRWRSAHEMQGSAPASGGSRLVGSSATRRHGLSPA